MGNLPDFSKVPVSYWLPQVLQELESRAVTSGATKSSALAFVTALLRTERGERLSFESRPYLLEILNDKRKRHVCVACAQSGKTVTYFAKTLHRLLNPPDGRSRTAIWTMPTATHVQEFVNLRIDTMLGASPDLAGEIANVDNSSAKQFANKSAIYFRGTQTEKGAISVPADFLVHDELDRSRPDTLQLYASRIRASHDPHRYLFSTPTVPGFGVSKLWPVTDQAEWAWTCFFCGEEQIFAPLDRSVKWDDQLDLEARCFRCVKCSAPVPRAAVLAGRWVRQNPGARQAGYHITGIMPPESTAESLCEAHSEAEFLEIFVQDHIGLAQTSGKRTLTPDMVHVGAWPNALQSSTPTFAGVDQGKYLDFLAGDGAGKIIAAHRFEGPDAWDQVASAMRTLNVRMLVGDMQPDARPLQNLIAQFPGRVCMADYSLDKPGVTLFSASLNESRVRIHRTTGLDAARERIIMGSDGGDLFPSLPSREETTLKDQLCAPERTTLKNAAGIPESVWIETGPDHFAHAHLYYTVASLLGPGVRRVASGHHKEASS